MQPSRATNATQPSNSCPLTLRTAGLLPGDHLCCLGRPLQCWGGEGGRARLIRPSALAHSALCWGLSGPGCVCVCVCEMLANSAAQPLDTGHLVVMPYDYYCAQRTHPALLMTQPSN